MCPIFVFQENVTPLDLLTSACFFFVVVYFSVNTQKAEIVIEKQIQMYLNFIDTKIKLFRDFWVFVLSPIPKNENSKVTEIHQKTPKY